MSNYIISTISGQTVNKEAEGQGCRQPLTWHKTDWIVVVRAACRVGKKQVFFILENKLFRMF